jgi:hypothetical protein
MQNRYVADIGDYVKLSILRALAPGRLLGVVWWLFPDETHNKDGSHREYLQKSKTWRPFDPQLFDTLADIAAAGIENVEALEAPSLLSGAVYLRDQIPCDAEPYSCRDDARQQWLSHAVTAVKACDLVFLDPDNGIATGALRITRRAAGKSVTINELKMFLRPDRTLIVYHHHTRQTGGHALELRTLANRLLDAGLPVAGALRAKPRSPRAFIIINGDTTFRRLAAQVADRWKPRITWHPVT